MSLSKKQIDEYLENLEDAVEEILEASTEIYDKSIVEHKEVYEELLKLYKLLNMIYDSMYYQETMEPKDFEYLMKELFAPEDAEPFIKIYKQLYCDRYFGDARTLLFIIADTMAKYLEMALIEQYVMVLLDVIEDKIRNNPQTLSYMLTKLRELKYSIEHMSYEGILTALIDIGVDEKIAQFLLNLHGIIALFYADTNAEYKVKELFEELGKKVNEVIRRIKSHEVKGSTSQRS